MGLMVDMEICLMVLGHILSRLVLVQMMMELMLW
jgi:hypothetical protein